MPDNYLHILTEEIEKLGREEKEILLTRLREEVDNVDAEITQLLIRRLKISLDIGEIKKTIGLDAYDAAREKEIGANIELFSEDSGFNRTLKRIYERIIDESRAIQKEREK